MTEQISRAEIMLELSDRHDFDEHEVLLLPLVPLVEMVVADDRIQQAEIDILKDYTLRLLSAIKEQSDGMAVVPTSRASEFINRLLNTRSDPQQLKRLRQLSLRLIELNSDTQLVAEQQRSLLSYCVDIAAASVVGYPYSIRGRVIEAEKRLLAELIQEMKLAEKTLSHCVPAV